MTAAADLRVSLVHVPGWCVRSAPYATALLTGLLRKHGFTVFPKDYEITLYERADDVDRGSWGHDGAYSWTHSAVPQRFADKYAGVIDEMADDLLADDPHVVGFTVRVTTLVFARELARRIKARRPEVYVIFGGPEMDRGPETHLAPCPEVDAICRQEADLSFPAFLEKFAANGRRPAPEPGFAYKDDDGEVVDCGLIEGPPPATSFAYADYADFDFNRYTEPDMLSLVLSRGCIYRCTFCSESAAFMKFRVSPADRLIGEIEHILEHANVARPVRVHFNDSIVNGNMGVLEEFADRLIARDDLDVRWSGMLAIHKKMTDEFVGKLARAGCAGVFFGMESGSPAILKRMRKGHTVEIATAVIERMKRNGIPVTLSMIVGHPGEGEKEFHETLNFLREHAHLVENILVHGLSLSMGSALTLDAASFGVDVTTMNPDGDSTEWVGDDGENTYELRHNRAVIAQHMLAGKVVDFGGPMERDARAYDPLQEVREVAGQTITSLQRIVRHVRVDDVRPGVPGLGSIDHCRLTGRGVMFTLSGWARDPDTGAPAEAVVLLDGAGRIVGSTLVRNPRPDVARALGADPGADRYGWELSAPVSEVTEPLEAWRVCVYFPAENRALHLGGLETLAALNTASEVPA